MGSWEEVNMGDEVTKFCISHVTMRVMESALKNLVRAWNMHHIPGPQEGIPNALAMERNVTRVLRSDVLSTSHMIALHEQNGNHLCRDGAYGHDPLFGHPHLQSLHERDYTTIFSDAGVVFQNIMHNDAQLFKRCVHNFIHLTNCFARLVE